MNLSIEDLEAIKAIVRKAVKDEMERVLEHGLLPGTKPPAAASQQKAEPTSADQPERPAEVVAHIPRA